MKIILNENNRGVTLIELMIVGIIITILAGLALYSANQGKTLERVAAKEAENYLDLIYNAQKMYHLNNRQYYLCGSTSCTETDIDTGLGIKISSAYFSYSITTRSGGNNSFRATAASTIGPCVMTIRDDTGIVNKSNCP